MKHETSREEQAIANMVTIGASDRRVKTWGKESLKEFLLGCRDLFQAKCGDRSMLLYSWYDEQAGQLRFSAIAAEHTTPPFTAAIEFVELDVFVEKIFKPHRARNIKHRILYVWTATLHPGHAIRCMTGA